MNDQIKDKCLRAYYFTDIEPTLDRLEQVKVIVENFEKDGANRLECALSLKNIDIEEIERQGTYLSQACEKMEKELERLKRYKATHNQDFATNHNGYYGTACEVLRHSRSHMSPLKKLFKTYCTRKHPNKVECEKYDINSKSVFESSPLGASSYQLNLFDLSSYPVAVQGLFTVMIKFFKGEQECLDICTDILEEEMEIMKDPVKSKYILDRYRRKAYKRLQNQIMLISDDIIESLKVINPAYQQYVTYASDEAFAQGEFHKHNTAEMDHLCLIEIMTDNQDITPEEKALWGNEPKVVKKIKYVISNFDNLLPEGFKSKMMGMFEYIFCKWALPNNIKRGVQYFIDHYHGKYKVVKYAGVNKHGSEYNKDSKVVKNFISAINVLLINSNDADLVENIA